MSIESVNTNAPAAQVVTPAPVKAAQAPKVEAVEAGSKVKVDIQPRKEIQVDTESVISPEELEAKIAELNKNLSARNQAVAFSTDASTGKDVVRVTNATTGELIRQLPNPDVLHLIKNMDVMMGLIFNKQA